MKKTSKFICALTAAIMVVCAAGCGSTEKKSDEAVIGKKSGDETVKTDGAEMNAFADGEVEAELDTDTVEVFDAGDFAEEKTMAADEAAVAEGGSGSSEQSDIKAGTLTAGEWNDNDNWGFLSNLINSGTIEFPSFGIDPRNRVAVSVKNSGGDPLVNAKVQLLDDSGAVLWNAVTDKSGTAYLFPESGSTAARAVVTNGGESKNFDVNVSSATDEQGNAQIKNSETVELVFDGSSELYQKTEIMFIVDATGSMSDEMLFLQSEFSAIAEEIGTENTTYSVNFYRDEGDEYVTKCSGFTDNIDEIQRTLNAESADGGGDTPEAVAQVMKETITDGEWSEDSVKIAFLIFDAPPHSGTDETLVEATKAASEKGIRLVPVVSSNSERDTELFARALAICTGGTYVFLTDDSGVGDSHLEPIIGDYKVEKLYDIIIRVINDYRQ